MTYSFYSHLKKNSNATISSDVTTTTVGPNSVSALLSINIDANISSTYIAYFSVAGSNSGATNSNYFRFMLNGSPLAEGGAQFRCYTTFGHSAAMSHIFSGLSGTNIIGVGWSVSAGTGRILAASNADHYANLIIEEILI